MISELIKCSVGRTGFVECYFFPNTLQSLVGDANHEQKIDLLVSRERLPHQKLPLQTIAALVHRCACHMLTQF